MSKKILIVDDEMHLRMLLEQTLEDLVDEHGVEIISASNGRDALEMILKFAPDLVFLDVMMPRMNGYEVCKAAAQDAQLHHSKIVLLTARGQELDRQQGMEFGACRYMTKPFDPDEILGLARKLLDLEQP